MNYKGNKVALFANTSRRVTFDVPTELELVLADEKFGHVRFKSTITDDCVDIFVNEDETFDIISTSDSTKSNVNIDFEYVQEALLTFDNIGVKANNSNVTQSHTGSGDNVGGDKTITNYW